MGSNADHGAGRGHRSRLAGPLLALGAVTYGTNVLLFGRFVFRTAWGGPPGLVTVRENPLWIPYRAGGWRASS